jgi:hypothetical protein
VRVEGVVTVAAWVAVAACLLVGMVEAARGRSLRGSVLSVTGVTIGAAIVLLWR